MRTIQEFDPTDYEFLLKSVIDSRLLFTTKKYIAEHIGYSSLVSKSIKSIIKTPFELKSIFLGLSEEVKFMCDGDIDLETFIYDYKKASDFYRQRMNINYFKNDINQISYEHFFDLLDMIFVSNQISKELPQKVKNIINDIYDEENDSLKIDIGFILMMALKILPTFNEGGDFRSSHENCTDDTKSSIEENFNTTVTFFKLYLQHLNYDYLIPLYQLERTNIEAPYGKDEYDKYSAIPVLNRITLYWYITSILTQIDINEHSTKLKSATEAIRENQLFPSISGFWCEDKSGLSDKYWNIQETIWGYSINICNKKEKIIEYDTAELYLYDYDNNYFDNNIISQKKKKDSNFRRNLYYGIIVKSEFIASYLDETISKDNSYSSSFICNIDFNKDQPKRIEFFPFSSNGFLKHCVYYPILNDSKIAKRDNQLEKKRIGLKYQCRKCLVAITWEYLYLGCMNDKDIMSQEESLPDLRYNRFYKVPKSLNPSFYDIGISSNICLAIASIKNETRRYIAAPDSLDYYEVTTVKDMEKHGIEIVDEIGQE